MQSLLNIDEYFVEEMQVKANANFKKQKHGEKAELEEKGEIRTTVNIKRRGNEPIFMIRMLIKVNSTKKAFENAKYQILLDIKGFFSFAKNTDEETISKMIPINGSSILYGVARGVIAQATANCEYGKFVLPAMNLLAAIKKSEKEKTK